MNKLLFWTSSNLIIRYSRRWWLYCVPCAVRLMLWSTRLRTDSIRPYYSTEKEVSGIYISQSANFFTVQITIMSFRNMKLDLYRVGSSWRSESASCILFTQWIQTVILMGMLRSWWGEWYLPYRICHHSSTDAMMWLRIPCSRCLLYIADQSKSNDSRAHSSTVS